MPDPLGQTISATEAPALWNASPYVTRWMLYHRFASGLDLSSLADERMSEGRELQAHVLARAARELQLEIVSNHDDEYYRRGLLGCTRDAQIRHPEKGMGALETKCVFDYSVWMSRWNGGETVPREYEIQLQQQMFVGDESGSFTWGIFAVWVAGAQHYFEREPNTELWQRLQDEAARFFEDVELGREPEPFGAPIETPWLMKMYPTVAGKVLDLRTDQSAAKYTRKARAYLAAKTTATAHTRVAEALRSEFIALRKDAETILLPDGASISMGKRNRLRVVVPGLQEDEANGE